MKTLNVVVVFVAIAAALVSCSKIGDFSVTKGNDKDVFESVDYSTVPDGYWLAHPLAAYVLDDKGNIVERLSVEDYYPFPGEVNEIHFWKDGALVRTILHYEFSDNFVSSVLQDSESKDYVIATEDLDAPKFVVDRKTREGSYSALHEDFLVTELTSSVFSFIWKWSDKWGYNRFTRIEDAEYIELIETCPPIDKAGLDAIVNRLL